MVYEDGDFEEMTRDEVLSALCTEEEIAKLSPSKTSAIAQISEEFDSKNPEACFRGVLTNRPTGDDDPTLNPETSLVPQTLEFTKEEESPDVNVDINGYINGDMEGENGEDDTTHNVTPVYVGGKLLGREKNGKFKSTTNPKKRPKIFIASQSSDGTSDGNSISSNVKKRRRHSNGSSSASSTTKKTPSPVKLPPTSTPVVTTRSSEKQQHNKQQQQQRNGKPPIFPSTPPAEVESHNHNHSYTTSPIHPIHPISIIELSSSSDITPIQNNNNNNIPNEFTIDYMDNLTNEFPDTDSFSGPPIVYDEKVIINKILDDIADDITNGYPFDTTSSISESNTNSITISPTSETSAVVVSISNDSESNFVSIDSEGGSS